MSTSINQDSAQEVTKFKKSQKLLVKLNGDWNKKDQNYKITISRTEDFMSIIEFYLCEKEGMRDLEVQGANEGDLVKYSRPRLKTYLVEHLGSDKNLEVLFVKDEHVNIWFSDRRRADQFKEKVRDLVEWVLNDSQRKGSGAMNLNIAVSEN